MVVVWPCCFCIIFMVLIWCWSFGGIILERALLCVSYGFAMGLILCWYRVGMVLFMFRYHVRIVLVWCWYCFGMVWYSVGIGLVIVLFGFQVGLVSFPYSVGIMLLWFWCCSLFCLL